MALNTCMEDALCNLDTLGRLQNHQTLTVMGDRLGFDDRYCQSVRRAWSGDGRDVIVEVIRRTFDRVEDLLKAYASNRYVGIEVPSEARDMIVDMRANVDELLKRLEPAGQGLQRLATFERYVTDASVQTRLARMMARIPVLHQRGQELLAQLTPPT